MIPKLITSCSYDFGDPAVSLVRVASTGVGRSVKLASSGVFNSILGDLKPSENKTVIHVIAVGDEEYFGPNRNGDGFSGADNRTAHTSFKDIGHVFRNHQSDDPLKAVGDVIATAHHERMHRIELMLSLDNDKCRKEVQALENGEDVPVSMGSMQDYDVCSVCQHRAPRAQDHCKHIRDMLGMVLDDGRKVYMQNPRPKYFDISLVFKPADRVAYTLRKIAAEGQPVIGGHELAEAIGMGNWASPKYAVKRTLATIQKNLPMTLRKAQPGKLSGSTVQELRKHAQLEGLDHLLAFLSANGWLLGPNDFGEVLGQDGQACEAGAASGGCLDELLDDPSELQILQEPDYPQAIPLSGSAVEDLNRQCGMTGQGPQQRVMQITIAPGTTKIARPVDPLMVRGLGLFYGHYKVAFAERHLDRPAVLKLLAATW